MKTTKLLTIAALAGALLCFAGCGEKPEESSSTALGVPATEIAREDSSAELPLDPDAEADEAAVQYAAALKTLTVTLEAETLPAGATEIRIRLQNDGDTDVSWSAADFRLEHSDGQTVTCSALMTDNVTVNTLAAHESLTHTMQTAAYGIDSLRAGEYSVLFADKKLTFTVQ